MFKMTIQFFILCFILFVGIFIGIDAANGGIESIQGKPVASAAAIWTRPATSPAAPPAAAPIAPPATVSPPPATAVPPPATPAAANIRAQDEYAYGSFIGRLGNKIGSGVQETARSGIRWVVGLLDYILG